MIATLDKTRQTRVLNTISIFAIGALLLVLFLHFRSVEAPQIIQPTHEAVIFAGETQILVDIADTPDEHAIGLSGTAPLAKNTGKLFVFNTPGKYGFWMKDMNYGLDIIWIDKDLRIVHIAKDVMPESYPEIFYPPKEITYVLEVPAGFSTANNISINQLLTLSSNLSF
jgi:uncharacterized membrane protein (UPF0127 family)